MARGWVKRKSVGSGREGRTHARQVFVESTDIRTRSIEADTNKKKTKACLRSLRYSKGRPVA
jgi:hypothetical protein